MTHTGSALSLLTPIDEANEAQSRAADPACSVWLSANAGTGKTRVLTNRYLRLLLPLPDGSFHGSSPDRILAITYTNAAASEMRDRILAEATDWCHHDDDTLTRTLARLTGVDPDDRMLRAARCLLTRLLECPGGLRIQTIHSFCQSVLGRFPIEAGLPPRFELLDEEEARPILDRAITDILSDPAMDVLSGPLARRIGWHSLTQAIRLLLNDRRRLRETARLRARDPAFFLNLTRAPSLWPDPEAGRLQARYELHTLTERLLNDLARGQSSGKRITQSIESLTDILRHPPKTALDYTDALYAALFLKDRTKPYKFLSDWAEQQPDGGETFRRLIGIMADVHYCEWAPAWALMNDRLLDLALQADRFYDAAKRRRGRVDYQDLIDRTADLLKTRPSWVLYKLDGGIDHILVDEAQDTSPDQWAILEALSDDFFSGHGRARDPRSLFVVGDDKQSIYGFQGADPDLFHHYRALFPRRAAAAHIEWRDLPLRVSFRSVSLVLECVDSVLAITSTRLSGESALETAPVRHLCFRDGLPGRVHVLPLTEQDNAAGAPIPAEAEARAIAGTVAALLADPTLLPSTGKRAQPADILVIVRNRAPLVEPLLRAFSENGIPCAGADRLHAMETLAVEDLRAAGAWGLFPGDDRLLGTVLKSPLVGWDDDRLMRVALGRTGTLWEAVQSDPEAASVTALLTQMIGDSLRLRPYDFFTRLLNRPVINAPHAGMSGPITLRAAMRSRLGAGVDDPLDAFLDHALRYSSGSLAMDLRDYLDHADRERLVIKRDLERGIDAVRVMTVHAAKGLQAPIVILADAHFSPERRADPIFTRRHDTDRYGLVAFKNDVSFDPIIGAHQRQRANDDREHARLLYVAMTRAQDWLIVSGHRQKKGKDPDLSWYRWIETALRARPDITVNDKDGIRLDQTEYQAASSVKDGAEVITPRPAALPDWFARSFDYPHQPPLHRLTPSSGGKDEGEGETGMSTTFHDSDDSQHPARAQARARGVFVHALLERLAPLNADQRELVALRYAARHPLADDKDGVIATQLVQEALNTLDHLEALGLCRPDDPVEVPFTARRKDGTRIEGRIDRLAVRADRVTIIDYKTDPLPETGGHNQSARGPERYRNQMALYAHAIQALYPDRPIHCVLVWTQGPLVIALEPAPDQESGATRASNAA